MTAPNPDADVQPAPAAPPSLNSDWRESAACRRAAPADLLPDR